MIDLDPEEGRCEQEPEHQTNNDVRLLPADDKEVLVAELVAQPAADEDEGANRQTVARDQLGPLARVGDAERVASHADGGEGVTHSDLAGEHGRAKRADEEDLS
ncbi:hypothetical protein FOPE_06047 [Fonsecaea pedrosoi]|nr:hypothetical protein FOPE_06047 [Fonsecaea pedrosoi]